MRCNLCGWQPVGTHNPGDAFSISETLYPVTKNGKAKGFVKGYLCSRCLKEANQIRRLMKSQKEKVIVTKHALERFLERQEGERVTEEEATITILKLFAHAHQIKFKEMYMAQRLLNNHGQKADYFFHAGWIFVVTQDTPKVILSVERQWNKRLGRDFWYLGQPESKPVCV